MWTDGRTDMMKLLVAFRNFANAAKIILVDRRPYSAPVFLPLSFYISRLNHTSWILSFKLHWYIYIYIYICIYLSPFFSYSSMRLKIFSFIFSDCLWISLRLVLVTWHAFFKSLPSLSNQMYSSPVSSLRFVTAYQISGFLPVCS
jgi:hypothetical protein